MTVPNILYNQGCYIRPEYTKCILPEHHLEYMKNHCNISNVWLSLIHDKVPGTPAGIFCLSRHQNCCGSLFLSSIISYVSEYRYLGVGTHIGHAILAAAVRCAEIGGYSSLECIIPKYVGSKNALVWAKMEHIALKMGFKELKDYQVLNARSRNTLRMFQFKLTYPNDELNVLKGESQIIKDGWDEPTYGVKNV